MLRLPSKKAMTPDHIESEASEESDALYESGDSDHGRGNDDRIMIGCLKKDKNDGEEHEFQDEQLSGNDSDTSENPQNDKISTSDKETTGVEGITKCVALVTDQVDLASGDMRVGVATTEISVSIDDPFDNTDEETLDYIDPFDINIFEHGDSDENHGIIDPLDSDASFDYFSDPESGFVTASPTDSETRRVGINDLDSFSDSDDSSEIVIFSDDDEFDYNGRQARTWNTKFQHNIPVYLTMEEVSERLEKLHVTRQVLWKTKPGKVALFPEVDGISMKKLCELYRKTGDYWIFARGARNRDSESNEVRWNRTVVLDDAVTFGDGVGDEHEGYDSVSEWDEEDDEVEEEEDVENTREREKMHFEEDEKDDIFHDAEEWLHTA